MTARKPTTRCLSRVTTGRTGPYIACRLTRGHTGWHQFQYQRPDRGWRTIAWKDDPPALRMKGPMPEVAK